jgi:TetR/AcrR family transcriptional regulator
MGSHLDIRRSVAQGLRGSARLAVPVVERVDAEPHADASPEDALDALVGRFLDFLAGDRNYVLLMQREALAERPSLTALLDQERLAEARRAIVAALGEEDADHVILELFALCWFPFAHSGTLVAALGFDAHDPEFLKRHRERIVRLFAGQM